MTAVGDSPTVVAAQVKLVSQLPTVVGVLTIFRILKHDWSGGPRPPQKRALASLGPAVSLLPERNKARPLVHLDLVCTPPESPPNALSPGPTPPPPPLQFSVV